MRYLELAGRKHALPAFSVFQRGYGASGARLRVKGPHSLRPIRARLDPSRPLPELLRNHQRFYPLFEAFVLVLSSEVL